MKVGTPNVEHLMTREQVKCCSPQDTLNQAANLLWDHDCGALPVVEDDRVIAMLTDRDICMAAYLQNRPLTDLPVSSAMSRDVYSCSAEDSLEEAQRLMQEHQVRRIPVTDDEGRLIGVVSLNDVVRDAAHDGSPERALQLVQTLDAIGERRQPEEDIQA